MYYRYVYFDIQHWIEISVECDVPAALTTSPHPVTYICWQGGSEGLSICLKTLEERNILSYKRVLNWGFPLFYLVQDLVYRLRYPEWLVLVYYLRQFYDFAYIRSLWFVPNVTSFQLVQVQLHSQRRDLKVRSRDRCRRGKEKFSEIEKIESEKNNEWIHETSSPRTFRHKYWLHLKANDFNLLGSNIT